MKPKVQESFGMALFMPAKIAGESPRLLLVKKRCTYYFVEFVKGNYDLDDPHRLRHMFNNMESQEKLAILSGNFDELWMRQWLTHPLAARSIRNLYPPCSSMVNPTPEYFYRCEKKYNATYRSGRLRSLMDGTRCISGIWELPKGRRNANETPLMCASREFHEEVSISPDDYELIDPEPRKFSLMDDNVVYNSSIFICVLTNPEWKPVVSFSRYSFIAEVSDMKFCNAHSIRDLNMTEKLREALLHQYNILSRGFKKLTYNVPLDCHQRRHSGASRDQSDILCVVKQPVLLTQK